VPECEAEVIQQSKKLASKTKQLLASMEAKNRLRSAQALKGAALRSAANELTPVPRVRLPPPPPRSLEGGDIAAISRILLTHRTGESVPLSSQASFEARFSGGPLGGPVSKTPAGQGNVITKSDDSAKPGLTFSFSTRWDLASRQRPGSSCQDGNSPGTSRCTKNR